MSEILSTGLLFLGPRCPADHATKLGKPFHLAHNDWVSQFCSVTKVLHYYSLLFCCCHYWRTASVAVHKALSGFLNLCKRNWLVQEEKVNGRIHGATVQESELFFYEQPLDSFMCWALIGENGKKKLVEDKGDIEQRRRHISLYVWEKVSEKWMGGQMDGQMVRWRKRV